MAKRGFFIQLSIDLIKVLKVNCNLTVLNIQEKIPLILRVILLIVKKEDCQKEIDIRQDLVFIDGKNKDMSQQNNPRCSKCK